MKFHLIAAVLSCVVLSLAYADVTETEQSLIPLAEVSQIVDTPVAVAEAPIVVASPEIQKVLTQIPDVVQVAADEQINIEPVKEAAKNTVATDVIPQNETTVNNRESKQLIGFIPSYVLRHAIRMAQEQQYSDVRSFRYNNEEDDSSDEIGEERAVRRRKRFRTRNSKDHLKKSHRHKNMNRRRLNKHQNVHGNRRTQNRRRNTQSATKLRRPQTKRKSKNKRKKAYKRGGY